MTLIARLIKFKPVRQPAVDRRNAGKVAVVKSAPPRVQFGGAPKKSLFERVLVKVTSQKAIDRERRAQEGARNDAVRKALREADTAMAYLLKGIQDDDGQQIKIACGDFENALEPFSREFKERGKDTPANVLDATELRGTRIQRLIRSLSKPDQTGSRDLTRLQTLHDRLEALPMASRKHPLMVHLGFAVKAELLHHAMARVTLDQARQEKDGHLRSKALKELTDMGDAAKEIGNWMQSRTFVMTGEDGKERLRYQNAIPGSRLTLDKLVAVISQADIATAIRTADKVATLELSTVSLIDLVHARKEIAKLIKGPHATPQDLTRYQPLHQELSSTITARRQKITAANKTTHPTFSDFKSSLHEALSAPENLLPTKLLGHAGQAAKAMATLKNEGGRLSRKHRTQWINKALKGADPGQLKRLQISLHYGECKWLVHDLSMRKTVRAKAALEHLSLLKEVLDARFPVPLPPAQSMIRYGLVSPAVAKAFRDHPYPPAKDKASAKNVLQITPQVMAALVSLTHLDASPQVLKALQGVDLGELVQALAQTPGQLDVLDLALNKLSKTAIDNRKTLHPLIAQLSAEVKGWRMGEAQSRTTTLEEVMNEAEVDELPAESWTTGLDDVAKELANLTL